MAGGNSTIARDGNVPHDFIDAPRQRMAEGLPVPLHHRTDSYRARLKRSTGLRPPAMLAQPLVAGTWKVGETLTCTTPGRWTGRPTPSIAYQWTRNTVAIPGETGAAYLLAAADQFTVVTVYVTAANSEGTAGRAAVGYVVNP